MLLSQLVRLVTIALPRLMMSLSRKVPVSICLAVSCYLAFLSYSNDPNLPFCHLYLLRNKQLAGAALIPAPPAHIIQMSSPLELAERDRWQAESFMLLAVS